MNVVVYAALAYAVTAVISLAVVGVIVLIDRLCGGKRSGEDET